MSNTVKEIFEISLDLAKLVDVEVRDERGATKIIIPVDINKIHLTGHGSAYLRLSAIPTSSNSPHHTHGIKAYTERGLRRKNDHADFVGNMYRRGRFEYDDKVRSEILSRRVQRDIDKERKNKYKGLEF